MKHLHYLAVAALALSTSAFAQSTPAADTAPDTAGLIGKRYAETTLNYTDRKTTQKDLFGPAVKFNLPINSNFDLAASYSHSLQQRWVNVNDYAGVTGLAYFTQDEFKPFVSLALGYVWGPVAVDRSVYTFSGGFEYAATEKLALTFGVNIDDDFKSHTPAAYSGFGKASYSFSKRFTGSVTVTILKAGSRAFGVSLAYKF